MENGVAIKSTSIFIGLMAQQFDPMLCKIAAEVIIRIQAANIYPVITSAYRPQDERSVHKYLRGLDFRTWDMKNGFISSICNDINSKWCYDPDRPDKDCLIFHDTGRGEHLHLQVHPNTVKRE